MTWYTMQIALMRNVIYIGESGRRISERIKDHNGRDLKSHIWRNSVESGHANFSYEGFKIIAENFNKESLET